MNKLLPHDQTMHPVIKRALAIRTMTLEQIERVEQLEKKTLAEQRQFHLETDHVLFYGMYSRTVLIPAGVYITGALIKIPTILVVSGECDIVIDDKMSRVTGYAVFPAEAGRKQVIAAIKDTHVTMTFPTAAKSIEEAEEEFTDEASRLASRREV